MLSIVVAIERNELVALESPVHVDIKLHILCAQWSNTKAKLKAVVTHLAEIGQKVVVGEGRH